MGLPGHRVRAALTLSSAALLATGVFVALSGSPVRARDALPGLADKAGQHVSAHRHAAAGPTYTALATGSIRLIEGTFYNGSGLWHMCVPVMTCNTKNRDWGADALTNLLYFRWMLTRDPTVAPLMAKLIPTAPMWTPGAPASSDSVMWDAVAEARMYQVTGSKLALAKAEAALRWLGTVPGLGSGACPAVDYQWPYGQRGNLKTIETATNYVKAALLLYQITGKRHYLAGARAQYADVRRYFLARKVPLYSAYMFDNGSSCPVLPSRYFASVNGNMIWSGQALAQATGQRRYLRQAVATARAVQAHLTDATGIFADLQADNDIVGPLVEAMYALATKAHEHFAVGWLMANASAAGADRNALGAFGRFFDGPPPASLATAWQTDGGIALAQAAAALDPGARPPDTSYWAHAKFTPDVQNMAGKPVQVSFTGRAIAIMGTIGAKCCVAGHARLFVDGVRTFNRTGIWQGYSSPSRKQDDQVLFAWRWPVAGPHVITISPAAYDGEEGGSFFQMTGYFAVP